MSSAVAPPSVGGLVQIPWWLDMQYSQCDSATLRCSGWEASLRDRATGQGILELSAWTWSPAGTDPMKLAWFRNFGAAQPEDVADMWARWVASDDMPGALRRWYPRDRATEWTVADAPALMEPLVRFMARRVTAAMRAWQLTQDAGARAVDALRHAPLIETPDGVHLGVNAESLVARYERRRRRLDHLGRQLAAQYAEPEWYASFCGPVG